MRETYIWLGFLRAGVQEYVSVAGSKIRLNEHYNRAHGDWL